MFHRPSVSGCTVLDGATIPLGDEIDVMHNGKLFRCSCVATDDEGGLRCQACECVHQGQQNRRPVTMRNVNVLEN